MFYEADRALKTNYLLTYFSRTLRPGMFYQVDWALKAYYLLISLEHNSKEKSDWIAL